MNPESTETEAVLEIVEAALERPLLLDEKVSIARMKHLGKTTEEIIEIVRELERPPLSDDELNVRRYEPMGDQAVEIPAPE